MRSVKALIAAGFVVGAYSKGSELVFVKAPEGQQFYFFNPSFQVNLEQAVKFIHEDAANLRSELIFPASSMDGDKIPFIILYVEYYADMKAAVKEMARLRDEEELLAKKKTNVGFLLGQRGCMHQF